MNNNHFRLEDVGKFKYILVRNSFSDNEEDDIFWVARYSNDIERFYGKTFHKILVNHFELIYTSKTIAHKTKQYSIYRLLELKEDWEKALLNVLDQYERKEDVSIRKVIECVYNQVSIKHSYKHHLLCYKVNNEKSLNMYGIMTRILFPIERIKGDITTMYKYGEKYIVIREFIQNRLYVIDFFNTKYRDCLWKEFKEENKYCNLHITFVQQDSDYYKAVYLADEERIKIILDDNATEKDRAIAKGLR